MVVAFDESGVALDDVPIMGGVGSGAGGITVGGVEVAGVIVESGVGGVVEATLSVLVAIAGEEIAVVVVVIIVVETGVMIGVVSMTLALIVGETVTTDEEVEVAIAHEPSVC